MPTFRLFRVTWVFVLLLLAFSSFTFAQSRINCVAARSSLSAARAALRAGDSASAVLELKHAIAADPNCADPYLLLGLTEFEHGETAKSIDYLKQGLKLAPRSYSGHYNLALAYSKEKKLQDARRELERAVVLGPKEANANYDLGIVLLELQQPAAALPYLRRAHAMEPDRPDGSFNIVRAELESGNLAKARRTAQEQGVRFKADFQWNAAVGQLFLKNGLATDAETYLRAAYGIRPESNGLRDQLAHAYLACKRPEDVLELVKSPQGPEERYLRGSALFSLHRFTEADEDSQAALAQAPEDPKFLILRVRLLQRAGDQIAALEMAQRVASLAPDWDVPFYLAGISNYFLQQYTKAQQNLARAFQLNPRSAAAVFLEGLAWAREGNGQAAEIALRRAISLQPENGRFQCHLGILLMRENHQVEAEELFKRAIHLKPEYALPHYELAKLDQQSSQWHEAAENLEKVISLDRGFTPAYYELARVYTRLGEKRKAAQMLGEFQKHQQQDSDESAGAEADALQQSDPD